ncbi:MAG: hypothetical protein ACLSFJ_08815 [Holdemania filiformis]
MDQRCCAYSFLKETSRQCDYEVASDELASLIAGGTLVKHQPELPAVRWSITRMDPFGKAAIRPEDFRCGSCQTDRKRRAETVCAADRLCEACALHGLRSRCKAYCGSQPRSIEEKPVPPILLDFWNLLSNVFFQMALKENRLEGVSEIPFVSRSYNVG